MNDCISVRYIYSACVVTKTKDVKILHDPWFTEGIYDGSWFQYPQIKSPVTSIGDVDYVYVSHIHPDHYDSKFLKKYFSKYGDKKILIADHSPNYLLGKMRADGFSPIVLDKPLTINNTKITIVPHKTGSISDVDSAIIIQYQNEKQLHTVVNVNDIVFDDAMLSLVKKEAGKINILLCGYSGAGPYPQTYFDLQDKQLKIEADKKKDLFFKRYQKVTSTLNADVNIPFAGKYILGGKLTNLNFYRGVPDQVEVMSFDPKAIVLKDNGGEINTNTLIPTQTRCKPYSKKEIDKKISRIKVKKMAYEKLMPIKSIHQLPIRRLLAQATKNAVLKSECEEDHFFCIKLEDGQYAVINANKHSQNSLRFIGVSDLLPTPRSELIIDLRYLFGLLTHIYHWNNADIGSQFLVRRVPNVFNQKAQWFLNFLAV
jgi:UDP-MurNAc hydroxylase